MATSRRQRVPANPGQPASPDDRAAVPTGPGQASPPTAGPVPPAVTRPGGRIPDNRILTVAELTGTWRIQEKPAWELEVGSRSGLDLARLYLYADDGSMTELPLREISSAGGELQCQYQSGGRSGRATFRQDPQGGIQFALDAEAPAPLIRAECALVAKELNGSWAPSGGIISELVFEGDSLVNFGGTLIRTDAGTFKEGAIRRAFQTGRKLNLQVQWDEGPGTANLVLLKRLDGTFYVAHPAALDSSGLRYYRLNPVDEPSSPLTANDLKASWQTARLSLLSFRTAGNVLGGELVARADRRFKGEINSVVFHGNRAALKWTYLAVSGAGSVRRQADGLLSVRLETDNVTWGGSVQMKQRETVKKMFADGAWYALQEYQAPPIPTNKPVEVALVRPDQHGLRVQAVGFPAGARCEIALRSGDPSLAKQITPEFADTFKTGTTLELEAPDTVGKRLFDRWEEADETKGTKAWISNNIDHVVVARYKGWQGTWKTENGKTFIVTQSGTRISAATPDASARFSGQLERQNSEEVLRGLWDDAYSYDLVAVLSADGQSFTGMKRRRAAASSSISTAFPAENLAARREE